MLAFVSLAIISLLECCLWLPLFARWRKPVARILLTALLITTIARVSDTSRDMDHPHRGDQHISRTQSPHGLLPAACSRIICTMPRAEPVSGCSVCSSPSSALTASTSQSPQAGEVIRRYQFGCTAILFASTMRHLRTTRPSVNAEALRHNEIPSLTVAIPVP